MKSILKIYKISYVQLKDGNEIYQWEGRLSNANSIPYKTRSTLLLARKHKLIELIVLVFHQRLKPTEQQQTLTELTMLDN